MKTSAPPAVRPREISHVVLRATPLRDNPDGTKSPGDILLAPSNRSLGGFRQNELGEPLPPETLTPPNAAKWGKKNMNLVKQAKTRVGNRQQMVRGVDERDWRVRRAKELYFGMILDMGGIDNVSTLQDKFARDLAFLIVMGEELQDGWISGREDFAPFLYIGYLKTAFAIATRLGLKRVARSINPEGKGKAKLANTLDEFIAQQEPSIKEEPQPKRKPGRPRLNPQPEEPEDELVEEEADNGSETLPEGGKE